MSDTAMNTSESQAASQTSARPLPPASLVRQLCDGAHEYELCKPMMLPVAALELFKANRQPKDDFIDMAHNAVANQVFEVHRNRAMSAIVSSDQIATKKVKPYFSPNRSSR